MKQRREIERRGVVGRHGLPPSAARIRIVRRLIKVPPRLIVEAGLLLLIRTLPRQHASGEAFLAGDMRRWHWNLVDVFKAPLVQIQTDRVVRVRINPVIFIIIVDLDVLLVVVISVLRELFMRILLTRMLSRGLSATHEIASRIHKFRLRRLNHESCERAASHDLQGIQSPLGLASWASSTTTTTWLVVIRRENAALC